MYPTWVASVDGLTSQNVMPVDGEGFTGKGTQKRWCLILFLKAGRVEMDKNWPVSLFQTLEATDENDLDFAIPVFWLGTHSDKEEDRNDRVGTYRGIRAAIEIGWLLELENLESDSSNLEIYSMANRKPMQIRKNGRDVAKTRFFCNDFLIFLI